MKKILIIASILLVMVSVVLTVGVCNAAPAKVYKWRIQSQFPRGDLSQMALEKFAADVLRRSKGQLEIKVFAEPEIVPMMDVIEATKAGTIEMMQGAGTIAEGLVPFGVVEFGLPWGYKVPEAKGMAATGKIIREWFTKGGFMDIAREEYGKHGLYYLGIHSVGPVPILVSTKPVVKIKDFKGLKIRSEGIFTEWQAAVGAVGTADIGPGDTYIALQKGTLDAAQWDISAITPTGGLNWFEVAPYWVIGYESDHAIQHLLINQKKWDSLPDNLKQVLKDANEAFWDVTIGVYDKELKTAESLVASGKIKASRLDANALKVLGEKAYICWDTVAKKNPACAKGIKLLKAWRGIK